MRDLLIRLDEKVQNGFAAITAKLDAMEKRGDAHDVRLKDLEIGLSDREALKSRFYSIESTVDDHDDQLRAIATTAKNAKLLVIAAWAVFGSAAIALLLRAFHVV